MIPVKVSTSVPWSSDFRNAIGTQRHEVTR